MTTTEIESMARSILFETIRDLNRREMWSCDRAPLPTVRVSTRKNVAWVSLEASTFKGTLRSEFATSIGFVGDAAFVAARFIEAATGWCETFKRGPAPTSPST